MSTLIKKKPIQLILHGGLGNQLFQYLMASLLSDSSGGKIVVHAQFLGKYQASRTLEIVCLIKDDSRATSICDASSLLLSLRLPKVMLRLTGKERIISVPYYGLVVDGYYQEPCSYQNYSDHALRSVVEEWREIANKQGLISSATHPLLTHLRLGDFFKSRSEAVAFAVAQLRTLQHATDLITDQEDIVSEAASELRIKNRINIVPTAGKSAWELLALMSSYHTITTNGSTLSFWASVLGERELRTTNTKHAALWSRLCSA